jgi:methionyl-tRNA formyltransferase
MSKTIVLYTNRNVGATALMYLVAKGYNVYIISEDKDVLEVASNLGCISFEYFDLTGLDFDLFLCVHGRKVIPKEYLVDGKMVNIHPCLSLNYKGHNPIKRYIENKEQVGSVESHYMVEEVDAGEIIHQEFFPTGLCNTYADFYNIANPFYYIKCIEKTLEKLGI